jgi:hypothetical protein
VQVEVFWQTLAAGASKKGRPGKLKVYGTFFLAILNLQKRLPPCLPFPVGQLRVIQSRVDYARYSVGRQLKNASAEGKRPKRSEGRGQFGLHPFFVASWLWGRQKNDKGQALRLMIDDL